MFLLGVLARYLADQFGIASVALNALAVLIGVAECIALTVLIPADAVIVLYVCSCVA